MKDYAAKAPDGTTGTFLSVDTQMDHYLKYGWSIFQIEDGEETLIATPETGFLVERPVFPIRESIRIGGE